MTYSSDNRIMEDSTRIVLVFESKVIHNSSYYYSDE